MPKNKPELKHLALDLGRPLMNEFLETDYLHYGYWEEGLQVKFTNLKKAQERFAEVLSETIPKNVKEILDVGCGTGEVAKTLLSKKDFAVDCVSPSEALNQIAQEKLGEGSKVHTCFFQDFRNEKKYDLVLFSESFQYVPTADALSKSAECLKPGGYLLICDFFKLPSTGKSPIGGGHNLENFRTSLAASAFETLVDQDITPFTSPTIDLRERLMKHFALPLCLAVNSHLDARAGLFWKTLKALFSARIKKKKEKYFDTVVDRNVFARFKSYRLILLRKTNA